VHRRPRVAHVTSVHRWDDHRILHKECRSLAAHGYDVHLVCAGSEPAQLDVEQVRITRVQRRGGRLYRMLRLGPQLLRVALREQPEIVHIHDSELLVWALLLRRAPTRLVYDVHEDLPAQILSKHWIAQPLRPFVSRCAGVVERFAARRADAVVLAEPPMLRRQLSRHAVTVQNFPEITTFRGATPPADPPYLIYVGGVSLVRGAEEMLDAIEDLGSRTGMRLHIAGPMQPASLGSELMAHPGWQFVEWSEWLNREEIARELAGALAGLVVLHPEPNYIEAYPVKMFEYMAASIPVIASDFPLWRRIIEECSCGILVNPLSVAETVAAVDGLLEDSGLRSRLGVSGRACVESRYSWEAQFDGLRALYGELLDGE